MIESGSGVVIYARDILKLDSDKQDPPVAAEQVKLLKEYCTEHGLEVVGEYAEEQASSARYVEMTEFLSNVAGVEAVLMYRLDCLGQQSRHILSRTWELWDRSGVGVVTKVDDLQTGEMAGRFSGVLTRMDREYLADRARKGLEKARSSGKVFGNTGVEYMKVKEALRLYDEDFKTSAVLRRSGVSETTFYRVKRVRDAIMDGRRTIDRAMMDRWGITDDLYNHVSRACKALYDKEAPGLPEE